MLRKTILYTPTVTSEKYVILGEPKVICILSNNIHYEEEQKMKIFLDDERKPPAGWKLVNLPEEAIELLKTGKVTDISLDHDLGEISSTKHSKPVTGYDVLIWIEKEVYINKFIPPRIQIHTANPAAAIKMKAAVKNIYKQAEKNT